MYIRRIKKVANLVKNIKNKLKCAFFATTNRSVPTEIKLSLRNSAAEIARHLRIFNNAGKLLVCSNRSGTVRRKVDFGNNHNSALFCVSNNLFDLLLRVISADRDIVHFNASPTADLWVRSRWADFNKLRIFFDFNSPALIVGQMPMKNIELFKEHHVKHSLDFVHTEKMPWFVNFKTAPRNFRSVINLTTRNLALAELQFAEFPHWNKRIISTCFCWRFDSDRTFRNGKSVALFFNIGIADDDNIGIGFNNLRFFWDKRQIKIGFDFDIVRQAIKSTHFYCVFRRRY